MTFFSQKDGDFVAMRIVTKEETSTEVVVFDLTDRSIFADNDWVFGQVEVYARSVEFIVEVTNSFDKGWVALDEFLTVDQADCSTVPEQATVTTIPPGTTPQTTPASGIYFKVV